MARIVKFTVDKNDKNTNGEYCIVERKLMKKLRLKSGYVIMGVTRGTVKYADGTKKNIRCFPRTRKLIVQHDRYQPLTPGEYSVLITDVK